LLNDISPEGFKGRGKIVLAGNMCRGIGNPGSKSYLLGNILKGGISLKSRHFNSNFLFFYLVFGIGLATLKG
jgi:hypothetical protein